MDPSQRANAAQMAARNIKQARPRSARGGRGGPVRNPSIPQTAPMQSQGGGLFGGSVQGTGSFDFAAPSSGISFPPPIFGSGSSSLFASSTGPSLDVSDNEQRRDPGDERASKKRFGGMSEPTEQNSSFQSSNVFGQSQQSNAFGSSISQANGVGFSFGASQPQPTSGRNFNTLPTSKPATGIFSFGSTSSQPFAPSPDVTFGEGAQEKPGNNLFSFAQQQQPQFSAPSAGFSFGSSEQPKKSLVTPPDSGFMFDSSVPQEKNASNLQSTVFGLGSPAAQENKTTDLPSTGFSFGSPLAPAKPPGSPFAFGQTIAQSSSSENSFGSVTASAAPPKDLFGAPKPAQSSNIFGSLSQQSATSPFSTINTPGAPTADVSGNHEQSPGLAIDITTARQSQSTAQDKSNLFGSATPAQDTSNIFKSTPSSTMFGNTLNGSTATSNIFNTSSETPATTHSLFASFEKQIPASNVFAGNTKPVEQPTSANSRLSTTKKPVAATSDLFGNLNRPVEPNLNSTSTATFESAKSPSNPISFVTQEPSSNILLREPQQYSTITPAEQFISPSKSALFESTHSSTSEPVTASNSLSPTKPVDDPMVATHPPSSGMFSLQPQTSSTQSSINELEHLNTADMSHKRIARAPTPPLIFELHGLVGSGNSEELLHKLPDYNIENQITEEYMNSMIPNDFTKEQKHDFHVAYRLRTLNKAMKYYFANLRLDADPRCGIDFYLKQRQDLLDGHSAFEHNERKVSAAVDEKSPSKRWKQSTAPIVQEKVPLKHNFALPEILSSNDTANQPNLNSGFTPKPPAMTASKVFTPAQIASPTPATKGKRKAEEDLTKDSFEESERRSSRQMMTPKLNGASSGSNTSNIFQNILDSPSKTSTLKAGSPKKIAPSPNTLKGDRPQPNLFETLFVPQSPTKVSTQASPTPENIFTPKSDLPNSSIASKNAIDPKLGAAVESISDHTRSTPMNLFSLKPPASATGVSAATVMPPTFSTGPINFMAQFGQKATQDGKDNEEKLMEQAKEEDMDSDEDEAEWEAKWKQKRSKEIKEIEDIAKGIRTSFVPGKGFSFGQTDEPFADTSSSSSHGPNQAPETPAKNINGFQSSTLKPLFGQSTMSLTSGDLFGPKNMSRTSTPGPVSSTAGSIFDAHASGKQVSFSNNIFGHLSDSGVDSGKSDDADDESGDEDQDEDSENRDPSYKPGEDTGSGPGTPVEETGAGIASAKKNNAIIFGSKVGAPTPMTNSGTVSPSGSLFDRVSKDASGNPIRQISTEEKENTQPSTANIFGDLKRPFGSSLSKSSAVPVDQTWKPDSPIRFGATVPSNETEDNVPALSVTAASPAKSASPSNFFGSSTTSTKSAPALFSNLFGSPTVSKPSTSTGVGFSFGGPTSTASSLYPSANSSRATSPGVNTDGDSAAEADPDAEKHEQIDLTGGGPGEEDEEALYEVRAKALKFSAKEDGESSNPWETKGVGPLRVLRHKDTRATRILLRADPSGTIVLNKAVLSQVNYEATGKTLKLLTAGDGGKSLETWILQVKTSELAQQLAEALESNKSA